MQHRYELQHGFCKTCYRETLVIARIPEYMEYPDQDKYEESDERYTFYSCPYCGHENEYDIKKGGFQMSECSVDDDIMDSLVDQLGISRCEHCGCALLFKGNNRSIVSLTFTFRSGEETSGFFPEFEFCKDCLENSSQKELVQDIYNNLTLLAFSDENVKKYENHLSLELVSEAFKNRIIS